MEVCGVFTYFAASSGALTERLGMLAVITVPSSCGTSEALSFCNLQFSLASHNPIKKQGLQVYPNLCHGITCAKACLISHDAKSSVYIDQHRTSNMSYFRSRWTSKKESTVESLARYFRKQLCGSMILFSDLVTWLGVAHVATHLCRPWFEGGKAWESKDWVGFSKITGECQGVCAIKLSHLWISSATSSELNFSVFLLARRLFWLYKDWNFTHLVTSLSIFTCLIILLYLPVFWTNAPCEGSSSTEGFGGFSSNLRF